MKKFKCTVSFQKCAKSPDFCPEVFAQDEKLAISGARDLARQCGYMGAVKKVTAKEVQE